ncbi:MAG: Z1 domain-containing protein [Acidobacteriaceae bacterium]
MTASVTVLSKIKPPLRWEPKADVFTDEFLRSKSKDPNGPSYEDLTVGDDSVLREAQRILGRCLPPTEPAGAETGLVVGYVQSGKTMSFETVISLARDNGYGMVIVFAGTKTNLREQSEDRLKKDLGIDEGDNWYHFSNPTKSSVGQIDDKLEAWHKRPTVKKAVLVTVLKQVDHLENLASVLKKLALDKVPVLVIDDESDQAGLNNKAAKIRAQRASANARSSTYDRICVVRDQLPHHSYLQYTATPQANLLLAQTDLLNPSFAELVTPGSAYTGGLAFFKGGQPLVIEIPTREVPGRTTVVNSAPKSLLSALRFYLLVCAQHALTKVRGKDRNRSMMVHPAMQTQSHKLYKAWMDKSIKTLTAYVEKQYAKVPAEVESRFLPEYNSLKQTYPDIRPLPDLIGAMVNDVFGEMNCVEVNGTPDAQKKVDWRATPYWILVGGAKLDRGYTVEGLTTTYMPRPLGNNPAADTLQQRARFFGYKRPYLGLCRVFLQSDVEEAFVDYVEHEEFVRKALVDNRGKPLRSWRRDFILDSLLRPTRPNVIGLSARRISVEDWMVPGALQRDDGARQRNQALLATLERKWGAQYGPSLTSAELPDFTGVQAIAPTLLLNPVPLKVVLEDFFLQLEVRDASDAEEHGAILIGLAELLREHGDLQVDVFLINGLTAQYRTRDAGRGFPAGHVNAPINQYFSQTAGTVNDKSFFSTSRISLQLRRFNLGTRARDPSSADMHGVTWFALNVPRALSRDLHIEDRR